MTVLGTDDRVTVSDTTSFPYSAVVQVWVDFDGDGSYDGWGTGAMISSNDVLTAGHVLWDSTYGYAKNIEIIPGHNGSSEPFGTATGSSWHVPDGYVSTGGSFSYDIGVINLSSSIGDQTGTFAVQANTASDLVGTTVTTAGYPGDLSSDGSTMITTSGAIDGTIGSSKVYYDGTLDTYGGQSGSPLWVTVNGETTIVGVHTSGGTYYNAGTVVTSTFYDLISGWTGGDLNTVDGTTTTADTVSGTSSADVITGSSDDDVVWGLSGDDTLSGGSGDDVIYGNVGSDLVSGGAGSDTIFGGQNSGTAGSDGLYRSGTETLYGGDGSDFVYGNIGADYLYGEAGADVLYGGQGDDTIYGGDDGDKLFGNLGADVLSGGAGADTLSGNAGNDTLVGGDGNDLLAGGSGDDLLYGDKLTSSSGSGVDTIDGGDGTDIAVYLNAQANYTVTSLDDGGVQVNGYDVLYNVEYIQFSDATVTVDSLL